MHVSRSVTIFVVVTEEPSKGCQLTPLKPQHQPDAVLYDKGVRPRLTAPLSFCKNALVLEPEHQPDAVLYDKGVLPRLTAPCHSALTPSHGSSQGALTFGEAVLFALRPCGDLPLEVEPKRWHALGVRCFIALQDMRLVRLW